MKIYAPTGYKWARLTIRCLAETSERLNLSKLIGLTQYPPRQIIGTQSVTVFAWTYCKHLIMPCFV